MNMQTLLLRVLASVGQHPESVKPCLRSQALEERVCALLPRAPRWDL